MFLAKPSMKLLNLKPTKWFEILFKTLVNWKPLLLCVKEQYELRGKFSELPIGLKSWCLTSRNLSLSTLDFIKSRKNRSHVVSVSQISVEDDACQYGIKLYRSVV